MSLEGVSFDGLLAAIGSEYARLGKRTESLQQELDVVRNAEGVRDTTDNPLPAVPEEKQILQVPACGVMALDVSLQSRTSSRTGVSSSVPVSKRAGQLRAVSTYSSVVRASGQSEVQSEARVAQLPSVASSAACLPKKFDEIARVQIKSRFAVDDDDDLASTTKFHSTSFLLAFAQGSLLERIVHGPIFESASGVLILSSAVVLGMETDHMAKHAGESMPMFDSINLYLNLLFCVEFLIRVIVDGMRYFVGKEWRWGAMDAVLVCCSVSDICLAATSLNFLVVGRALRLMRLLRLVRTVRLVRSLRFVREFHKMMYAVLSSLRTLMCSLMILFFVIYFFSILICQGVAELSLSSDVAVHTDLVSKYGSVPRAFYTLFASACTGIDWDDAFYPLRNMHEAYRAGFLVYIALILFGVTNIVTSVFVESAIMSAQHYRDLIVEEKQNAKEVAVMHMKEVFKQIDADGSGEISSDEMEYFLTEPNLKSYVDALGISPENTRMLFRLMDLDESGKIDVNEFCDGCLRLQGEAKSMDVHTMIFQVRRFLAKWSEFTAYVEDRFAVLTAHSPHTSVPPWRMTDLQVQAGDS